MATLAPLATLLLLLTSLAYGQRFNVNRGLQRPGGVGVGVGVGGRGPQRPVGPGGGVFLNPEFPSSLVTPATPPNLPRIPGNPNDFRNPAFPGFAPDRVPAPGSPPGLSPSVPGVLGVPGMPGVPGVPGQQSSAGFPSTGFRPSPNQGFPGQSPAWGQACKGGGGEEGEHADGEDDGEGSVGFAGVQPGSLTCYSCKLDFRKADYDWSHPCLGRHNGLNVSTDYLVPCGPKDAYCKAERMEVNGILIYLARECTDICHFGCRPRGFGISYETCSKCCQTPACNHMYPPSLGPPPPLPHGPQLLLLLCLALADTMC